MGHLAMPMGAVGLQQGMTSLLDKTHMSWLTSPCSDPTRSNCVQLLSCERSLGVPSAGIEAQLTVAGIITLIPHEATAFKPNLILLGLVRLKVFWDTCWPSSLSVSIEFADDLVWASSLLHLCHGNWQWLYLANVNELGYIFRLRTSSWKWEMGQSISVSMFQGWLVRDVVYTCRQKGGLPIAAA